MSNSFWAWIFAPRRGKAVFSVAVLTACMLPLNAGAWQITQQPITQQPSTGNNRTSMPSMPDMSAGPSPMNPARLEKMREEERRKRLLADTARLVQLTNELKEEVDKASRDELSLDVVRKAAEIEKLARDVKDRMKG